MKKQTSIYLSEKEMAKLKKLKDIYDADSNSSMLRELLLMEYDRMCKYEQLLKETI